MLTLLSGEKPVEKRLAPVARLNSSLAQRLPLRLLLADDAEVADVRKVGDDEYEISFARGKRVAVAFGVAEAHVLEPHLERAIG